MKPETMKLFEDDLLVDSRDPLLSFAIPGIHGDFGLFAPRWELWKQLISVSTQTNGSFTALLIIKLVTNN